MTVHLIAHRGMWKHKKEQNTLDAFKKALDYGVGIETDFRDGEKKLEIKHDPYQQKRISAEHILKELAKHPNFKKSWFALNVKSDGLQKEIAKLIKKYKLEENSFVFDMSGPSHYLFAQILPPVNIATRWSDFETPILLHKSNYIWVDQMEREWFNRESLKDAKIQGKTLCFVSSEIHGRDPENLWEILNKRFSKSSEKVLLCTDRIEDAQKYFFHSL